MSDVLRACALNCLSFSPNVSLGYTDTTAFRNRFNGLPNELDKVKKPVSEHGEFSNQFFICSFVVLPIESGACTPLKRLRG